MQRRRFLNAVGIATGVSAAGCSDVELDERTPPDDALERIRFLERQRALLLYVAGMQQVNQAETDAAGEIDTSYTKIPIGDDPRRAFFHGHVAGLYDAASTCFELAWSTLGSLEDLPLDDPVTAAREAHVRAEHLGRAHVHLGNLWLEQDVTVEGEAEATPTPTESGGQMAPAQPTDDDGGTMAPAQQEDDFHRQGVDDQQVLAEDHLDHVAGTSFAPASEVQSALGLAEE